MRPILLFTIFLCALTAARAQTMMGRQIVDQFPKSASGTPTYGLTWLPENYDNTTRRYPLIIFLHGSGEGGTTVADLSRLYTASPRSIAGRIADGWNATAINPITGQQDSFIVVSPQAPSWSYSYTELKHILPSILSRYRVDTSRIYLTGLSAGGGGVYSTFGSRDSNFIKKFAAMMTVNSAGVNASNGYTSLQVEAGIRYGTQYGCRMWTIAGEGDYLLTTDTRYHDSTNMPTIPTRPNKYTVIAGLGHNAWGKAYDPAFRPTVNYYGNSGTCNNGCAFGGIPVAPNTNGSTVRGSGKTQDSLNVYEWLLLSQRTFAPVTTPSANAGPDKSIVFPIAVTTLNGSGTAGEGHTISSYTWTKISGPSSFLIVSPSNAITSITGLVPGSYTFRLTVRNSNGVSATDDVQVFVTSPLYGSPLITSITTNQSIVLPINLATVSLSYALNGASLTAVEWKKLKTPGQTRKRLGIIGSSSSQGGGSSTLDSSYTGRLRNFLVGNGIIDSFVNLAWSGYNVFRAMPTGYVATGNQSPVDPNVNVTAILNRNVDVVIVNYPSNAYDVLSIGEIMMAYRTIYNTCVARGVECYITTTQPRDDFGPTYRQFLQEVRDSILTQFGDHAINFYDPLTTPGTNTIKPEYSSGDNIHINDAGHRQLFNKVVAANIFGKFATSPAAISSPLLVTTLITGLTQGTHVFLGTVTDSHGQSVNATTTITVNPLLGGGNQNPVAVAGSDQTITLPANTVTLSGSGTDTDGSVDAYQWTKIAGPTQFTIVSPNLAQTVVNNLAAGTYRFELRVTDNQGAFGRDTITINVNAALPGNQSPVASAGTNQSITLPVNSVSLAGSGTDADGSVASYQWTKITGPTQFTIATPTQAQTAVNNLVAGVYTFELNVTDNQGAVGRDTVTVTVAVAQQTGNCAGRSFNPAPAADSGYYNYANLLPGDTLFIDGSRAWSYIYIEGKNGTPQCPIVIMNKNGQARLRGNSAQFKLRNCTNIKILGTGTSGVEYGFYIQPYPTNVLVNGAYAVSVEGRSKNVEISNVHITHAGIGMNIKEDGGCDPNNNYPNWVIDSIKIHHNKIVKTWNQGMYIGNTSPDNGPTSYSPRPVVCNGVTTYPKPVRMGNIKVYDNIIDSTGRAGVQISSASTGLSEVYNNTITHSGIGGDEAQGAGINLGAYSNVWVYNNNIRNTLTFGISSFGASSTNNVLKIENNIIDSSGYMRHYYLWESGVYQINLNTRTIYNNTIPWVYSIGLYTKPTENPVDSTRFRISGNSLGYRKNAGGGIVLSDNQNTFHKSGNYVCNNIATAGGSTTVVIEEARIPVFYSADCSNPTNINPIANAGNNQTITLPVNTVTVTGTGTDADGSIAAYQWSKIAGPTQFNMVSPNQAQTVINNLAQGTYRFELRVIDNVGGIGRDTLTITVNAALPGNQAPVANAGNNQTITLPVNTATLSGSGTDTDGSISAYQWTKIAGPTQFTIATPAQAQTAVNNLAQGTYSFELRVTDNQGAVGRDTVVVTVNPPIAANQAPVANAGNNQTITLPLNSVTFTGSGTDADGSIAGYQWTKIAGPTQFTIVAPTQAQTAINNLVQGTYSFELRVTDNQGAVGRDTIVVTVNAPIPGNVAPIANAGNNQTITLPVNTVTLSGSGTDADGSISAYQWIKIAGPTQFTIANPAQAQTTINNLVQGSYSFELRVTDNQGAVGRDTIVVTVNAMPNQAPVANAGLDRNITLPVNVVTLSGSGTDADGSIAAYQWTKIAGPTQFTILSPSQAQTNVNNLAQGVYRFELRVTDNLGATGRDTVTVTVGQAPPPPNVAPTANAGLDRTITLPVNMVTLNGSGNDPDGSIASYQWTKIAGPTQFLVVAPTLAQTNINNLTQGVYRFELRVTDNLGATGRDTVTVTVGQATPPPPVNLAPTANAGTDISITLPVNSVSLTGSGTDADGTIAAYQWRRIAGPSGFSIQTSSQPQTTITNLVEGVYRFELQVTDNLGATGRDTITVTVNAEQQKFTGNRIYPNPATSHINIELNSTTTGKASILIYDLKGVLVHQRTADYSVAGTIVNVNVSTWQAGTYFVRIGADPKVIQFIKL